MLLAEGSLHYTRPPPARQLMRGRRPQRPRRPALPLTGRFGKSCVRGQARRARRARKAGGGLCGGAWRSADAAGTPDDKKLGCHQPQAKPTHIRTKFPQTAGPARTGQKKLENHGNSMKKKSFVPETGNFFSIRLLRDFHQLTIRVVLYRPICRILTSFSFIVNVSRLQTTSVRKKLSGRYIVNLRQNF